MTLRYDILCIMAFLFSTIILRANAFVLGKNRPPSARGQVALARTMSSLPSSTAGLPGDPVFDVAMMKLALRHAQFAYRQKEVPIGAIVVSNKDGTVLSTARNSVEKHGDATAHAEMLAIRKASSLVENWRLLDCTLYTTLEPCPMCMGAIQGSRIDRVVYGAKDIRIGACGSWVDLRHGSPVLEEGEIEEKAEGDYHNRNQGKDHSECESAEGNGMVYKPHPYHSVTVTRGILEYECGDIIRKFFKWRRREATMRKQERKQLAMNDSASLVIEGGDGDGGVDGNRRQVEDESTNEPATREEISPVSPISAVGGMDEEFEMVLPRS